MPSRACYPHHRRTPKSLQADPKQGCIYSPHFSVVLYSSQVGIHYAHLVALEEPIFGSNGNDGDVSTLPLPPSPRKLCSRRLPPPDCALLLRISLGGKTHPSGKWLALLFDLVIVPVTNLLLRSRLLLCLSFCVSYD